MSGALSMRRFAYFSGYKDSVLRGANPEPTYLEKNGNSAAGGFYTEGNQGDWSCVDNIELFQASPN